MFLLFCLCCPVRLLAFGADTALTEPDLTDLTDLLTTDDKSSSVCCCICLHIKNMNFICHVSLRGIIVHRLHHDLKILKTPTVQAWFVLLFHI